MKSLRQYIVEAEDADTTPDYEMPTQELSDEEQEALQDFDEQAVKRDIKYTLWEDFETKVKKLRSNTHYQKIEYKYIDDDRNLQIDFLLGFDDGSWKLWVGKIGGCGYDDPFYEDLEEEKFSYAVVKSLDIIINYIKSVIVDKEEYLQYYIDK